MHKHKEKEPCGTPGKNVRHRHYQRILKITGKELKHHLPFTLIGAGTGMALLVAIVATGSLEAIHEVDELIFFILHPTHVFLSALVTTALFMKYGTKSKWRYPLGLVIGITGSLGIATLSDSIIPYMGELIVGLEHAHTHVGFIEQPILTITPALAGTLIGFKLSATKFPHLGHVLLSTYASLFHVIMGMHHGVAWWQVLGIFVFLFLAVWLPCCLSDIIYPMLFMRKGEDLESCMVCREEQTT